ncbi:MAG: DEAD/DEAH box helicase [Oscillospiraceae bacterium]
MEKNFLEFNISDEVKKAIEDLGFTEPTSIQTETIPLILDGYDVIGHSQTGSGKTAAFGIPAVESIDMLISPRQTQVLILCPTRELAVQASEDIKHYAKYKKINIVPVFGGEQIDRQILKLRRGCQIVVGTPGRIMDHMRRKTLKFDDVRMVILDEADEMLNMGFVEDIETILEKTPADRQTILFSATMPPPILQITKRFQKDPKIIKIQNKQLTVSTIEQKYFDIPRGRKTDALCALLAYYRPERSIIFCNTKKMVDELVAELDHKGFLAQGLHGDMKQSARTNVMNRFKEGKFKLLIATDVAARGIDVNDLEIVFNYDLPQDNEYYVHRIGRTGRAGKDGKSFTLIQGSGQFRQLKDIMRYIKIDIERGVLPTAEQIGILSSEKVNANILAYMGKHDSTKYGTMLSELIDDEHSLEDVAAALYAMAVKKEQPKANYDIPAVSFKPSFDRDDRRPERRSGGYDNRGGDRGFRKKPEGKREYKSNPKNSQENADVAMIRISVGKDDKISASHILGAVAGESGVPGREIGNIAISNSYTNVDVPKKYRDLIVKKLNNARIKGIKVTVE